MTVAMVIETRPPVFSLKIIVVISRFGRFLHGFQETFPSYLKFEQQCDFTFFFCFAKFRDLFLSIFNDLKIFKKYC